jgi:hypothetical protein
VLDQAWAALKCLLPWESQALKCQATSLVHHQLPQAAQNQQAAQKEKALSIVAD